MGSELSNFSWDLFGEALAIMAKSITYTEHIQCICIYVYIYILYTSRGEDAQCHRFGSTMLFSTTSPAVLS